MGEVIMDLRENNRV